jgi:hypothetical protein
MPAAAMLAGQLSTALSSTSPFASFASWTKQANESFGRRVSNAKFGSLMRSGRCGNGKRQMWQRSLGEKPFR